MNGLRKILVSYFDVVTFDIFDTLIERTVKAPWEVFRMAGEDILGKAQADAFCVARQEAERIARRGRQDGEVTLEEIYVQLHEHYREKADALMYAEIDRELACCHPRLRNVSLMRYCLEVGKKVFLISDMYLPTEIIAQMLEECGIKGFQKLYVSCDYRKNKVRGELFRIVMEENQISSGSMLHIGDSIRADIFGAARVGIPAVWVRRKNGKLKGRKE